MLFLFFLENLQNYRYVYMYEIRVQIIIRRLTPYHCVVRVSIMNYAWIKHLP